MNRWGQIHNALSYQRVCIGRILELYGDNARSACDRYMTNILTRNTGVFCQSDRTITYNTTI